MIPHCLLLSLFVLVTVMIPRPVWATCCVTPPWQQVAYHADFVGVVECVTAGGPVARYKVEQSWKGLATGSEFLTEWPEGVFTHRYPISLCGNRMLMMAFKKRSSETLDSSSLFWAISADYTTLETWSVHYDVGLKKSFGDSVKTIQDIEPLVRRFLEASESEQERELIFAVARNYQRANANGFKRNTSEERSKVLESAKTSEEDLSREAVAMVELQKHRDVRSLVKDMIRRALEEKQWMLIGALNEVGGRVAFEMLNEEKAKGWPPEHLEILERALSSISSRLNDVPLAETKIDPFAEVLDASVSIQGMLVKTRQKIDFFWPDSDSSDDAFYYKYSADIKLLIAHDPDFLSDRLLTWSRPNKDDWGYLLVRDFCLNCGKDREANFTKLQKAQDPFVHVMAAIYLRFENEAAGRSSLQECAKLPGEEGAWAALTLARRGDEAALARALEVFAPHEKMEGATSTRAQLHYVLQRRLLVLLSNSAQVCGIPPPSYFDNYNTYYPGYGPQTQEGLLRPDTLEKWWAEHSTAIRLYDPWLSILEKAKRD